LRAGLERSGLTNFGYEGVFTRDLFEAELAVPGFPQPLHLFVAHLKSGTSSSDDAARRGAEALAISNFFVTGFLTTNALHPYLLAGDVNEDIAIPATGSQQPIQRLTNGTGLRLTTPLPPTLNTSDSATASDHLPVQIVFNHPFVQPFRITSLVPSNQAIALEWESVPGQTYTVESAASLGATNAWTVLAEDILATNYFLALQTNSTGGEIFFRVKRSG
jgi:hypothetical protein